MAILTISRECRSGSNEIGTAVAQGLGYEFVNRKIILADIKKYGKRWPGADLAFDENSPSIWERFDWEYQGLIALVESIIYERALKDNAVIIGRGGNYLLRDIPHALRVRLVAPLEIRVRRMMKEDGLGDKAARREIARIDKSRADYVNKNYGHDWEDVANYDMVFNSGSDSYEDIAKILIATLKDRDKHKTRQALNLLAGRAEAARIKAAVSTDTRLNVPTLEVVFDGTSVLMKGVIHNPKEHHLIEEIISKITVSHPIINEMHYRG
jgi:cytidylate kinase